MSEERNYEQEASDMGWTPKEEFKGPEEKWVDAETFVKRGESFVPFLKKQVRELKQDLDMAISQNRAEIAEIKAQAEKDAYDRAIRDFEEKGAGLAKREASAVAEGDSEEYLKVKKEKERLDKEKEKLKNPEKAEGSPASNLPPEVKAWGEKNPWYGTNEEMTAIANVAAKQAKESGKDAGGMLEAIDKRVRDVFPGKFENQRRSGESSVEGDEGRKTSSGGGMKSFKDLPVEAKRSYERLKKKFEIKGRKFTQEEYYKSYMEVK